MSITVKHLKVSAIVDDPAAAAAGEVLPSDWNADHDVEIDALDGVPIGATTPATGRFTTLTTTGQTSLGGAAGSESLRVYTPSATGTWLSVRSTAAVSNIGTEGTSLPLVVNTNSGIFSVRSSSFGGVSEEQFRVTRANTAVNYVQVTGSATLTGGPTISAQGSDFNIPLRLQSKGISAVELGNPAGWAGLTVTTTNNPNRIALNAPATGFIPTFTTAGVDTNAGMAFISKGTGAIDLAAGSSGVNISNGGTVTALTRTTAGSNYTSFPAIAISAPTTAGGVQATAVVSAMTFHGTGPTAINSGGSGYAVGNVLTVASGAVGGPCTLTVTSVGAGGAVTGATHTNFGALTTLPTAPYSVTGGTGTGATFTSPWQVANQTITNAGSGYVEQPTVTFSGGGGSGAAAYATVGSGVSLKTLGGTLTLNGSSGDVFRVYDFGGQAGIGVRGHTLSGTAPVIFPTPSNSAQTNISMQVASLGTGAIQFSTGGSLSGSGLFNQIDQFRVLHTASAVNYVQVTGGVTGGAAVVQFTGSDANVLAGYFTKGSGSHSFYSAAGASRQVRIDGENASAVNYLDFYGASAGAAPSVRVGGSDTNIDLTLTPKAAGNVRFGTYTGTALPIAGYIEIKDSGGTIRKLAVVA